jgi:ABC-type transport system substrate-binding protein
VQTRSLSRAVLLTVILVLFASQSFASINYNLMSPLRASAQTPPSCPANSTFRWTLIGSPPSLNPNTIVTNTAGFILLGLEYTGVETWDPSGNVNNNTFFTSSITHNSNYTQWVFNVPAGLHWSDGSPITAQDIVASENMSANPTYNYVGLAGIVTKATAPNATTAIFDLNVSDAWLPVQLTQDGAPGINTMPAAIVAANNPSGSNLGTNVVNGPFYISGFTSGDLQAVMYRNPYFSPAPKICNVQISFVDSLSLGAERLQAGSTDLAFISPTDAGAIAKTPNLHVLDEKGIGVMSLQYNDSIFPYNNTSFRQALAYGINQSELISQALSGYGVPAYNAEGIVSPIATKWYDPSQTTYPFNQTTSLSLLRTMGITNGSDGLLHYSNGTAVTLTIWTDSGNSGDLIAATTVQKDLTAMGFSVNIQVASTSNIVGDYVGNLQGVRSAMILFTASVANPGVGYVDTYPGWAVYWAPPVANPYWIYPPSANAEYESNFTAFQATDNFTLDHMYLDNIQALNSQYLPTIVLSYPDELYGYSTQNWVNWPSGFFDEGVNSTPNFTAWYSLTPATSTSAATSTTAATTSSSLSSSTSNTGTSGGSSSTIYIAIAAIIIVIIVIGAVVFMRRRPTAA